MSSFREIWSSGRHNRNRPRFRDRYGNVNIPVFVDITRVFGDRDRHLNDRWERQLRFDREVWEELNEHDNRLDRLENALDVLATSS